MARSLRRAWGFWKFRRRIFVCEVERVMLISAGERVGGGAGSGGCGPLLGEGRGRDGVCGKLAFAAVCTVVSLYLRIHLILLGRSHDWKVLQCAVVLRHAAHRPSQGHPDLRAPPLHVGRGP